MKPSILDLTLLPGARRHVHAIERDLVRRRSCVWLLPTSMIESTRLRPLLDLLGRSVDLVDVAPPLTPVCHGRSRPAATGIDTAGTNGVSQDVATSLSERLARLFPHDADEAPPIAPSRVDDAATQDLVARIVHSVERYLGPVVDRSGDPLHAVADLEVRAGGVTVVVNADAEHDRAALMDVVRRYPVLAREARPDSRTGVTLLVAGSAQAIPDPDRLDPLTTGVHWWWGVLGRIDLLTVVATEAVPEPAELRVVLNELSPDLVPEVIAEVVGPDVEMACLLARCWDGSMAQLRQLVRTASSRPAEPPEANLVRGRPAVGRPPMAARGFWSAGGLEVWGGLHRTSLHLGDLPDEILSERVWLGQARALNPLLDEVRRVIVRLLEAQAPVAALTEVRLRYNRGSDLAHIELNDLRRAVKERAVALDGATSAHLEVARHVRNSLAHRKRIEDWRLRQLAATVADLMAQIP